MPRPNILILMADQFNGTFFPDGPADFIHAPHLKALAERSVRFANTYTASPLCAPARASFMSGQLPSRTRVYDNAAEFASDIPTYAHHLRAAGYYTGLSGKMHFVGPDQLHGFEERLTTDIYPADFGWTPDYSKPGERIDWWYHNLGSVTGAGVAEITNQMEYDDEVAYHATRKLYDLSRRLDDRPWCLTVSFTHPHDPYVARRKFWDLYEDCPALDPQTSAIAFEEQDPHSKRLLEACDHEAFDISPEQIRRARRGYFANISYIDEKVGEILDVLKATRMEEDTIILFLSDHGDMLGERGLWFKMCFFEGSARVPLMIAAPGWQPALIDTPASTLDVTPTLCGLAGLDITSLKRWTDGEDLAAWLTAPASVARCRWNMPPKARSRRSSPSVTAATSCRSARLIRRSSMISRRTLRSGRTSRSILSSPTCFHRLPAKSTGAGDCLFSMLPCGKVRRGAGWSTRRCATALITRGITSRYKRLRNAICATTWTSTCWRKTSVFRAGSDAGRASHGAAVTFGAPPAACTARLPAAMPASRHCCSS